MAVLSVNVDSREKDCFGSICTELGMNISTAINVFIKAVNRTHSIPFPLSTETTVKKKPLTAKNIKEMLSVSNDDDFREMPAAIEAIREITKDDVW